ncbi:MAG: ABC transporter substrate-binding protein [Chloroflexota bacterium]
MGRFGTILKKIGKVLLWIILALAVAVGAFFVWLRIEPDEITECEAGLRLFEHVGGVTCIPEAPERVLAYSTAASQFYIAIGQPMAMMVEILDSYTAADIPGLNERLREINADTLDLGRVDGTLGANLELLLQIDPDVIVSEWIVSDDIAKTTSVIAPVVFITYEDSWKDVTLAAADVVNEKAQAEEMIEAYEARVEILQNEFDDPSSITVSAVRLYQFGPSIQLPGSFSGQILSEIGFSFPEAQAELMADVNLPNRVEIDFSEERIDLIDGDHLFIYGGFPDYILTDLETNSDFLVDEFVNAPLFPFIKAAETGNVYEVDVHWSMMGIYSAHYLLDDLFRHVAGVDPKDVAPNPLRLE